MVHMGKRKREPKVDVEGEEEDKPVDSVPNTRKTSLEDMRAQREILTRAIVLEEIALEEEKLRSLLIHSLGSVELPIPSMLSVLGSVKMELEGLYDKKMEARGG